MSMHRNEIRTIEDFDREVSELLARPSIETISEATRAQDRASFENARARSMSYFLGAMKETVHH
ncbi:hypothetical protein [Deinococcus sonorensis]|uniref:Uncharacterized protein n=2 Tax=Deinococcus sonorensis TaxID=309891 RepID=A0AAU7UFA0_9DEIO